MNEARLASKTPFYKIVSNVMKSLFKINTFVLIFQARFKKCLQCYIFQIYLLCKLKQSGGSCIRNVNSLKKKMRKCYL